MKNKTKDLLEKFQEQAKNCDWDDLSFEIINIEYEIREEEDSKLLKLLALKLSIFEEEKKERIFESFDMEKFLNKDFEGLEL